MESIIEELADMHALTGGTMPADKLFLEGRHLAFAVMELFGASDKRGEAA